MAILQYFYYYEGGWEKRFSAELTQTTRDQLEKKVDLRAPEDFSLQRHKMPRKRFNYTFLSGNTGCLIQTHHRPEIKVSRGAGSLSHAIIFDLAENSNLYPIELYDWSGWTSSIPKFTGPVSTLSLPLDPPINSPLREFEETSGFDATVIGQIVQQAVRFLEDPKIKQGRVLLKGDSYDHLAAWLYMISTCFPVELARRLTFSLGFPGSPPEEFLCGLLRGEVSTFRDYYSEVGGNEGTQHNNRLEFFADKVTVQDRNLSTWAQFCCDRLRNRKNKFLVDEFREVHAIFRLIRRSAERLQIGRVLELSAQILSQECKKAFDFLGGATSGVSETKFREFLVEFQRMFWPFEEFDPSSNPENNLIRDAWVKEASKRIEKGRNSDDRLLESFLHVIGGWEDTNQFLLRLPKVDKLEAERVAGGFINILRRLDDPKEILKVLVRAIKLGVSPEGILKNSEVAELLAEKRGMEIFDLLLEDAASGSSELKSSLKKFFPTVGEGATEGQGATGGSSLVEGMASSSLEGELAAIYDLLGVERDLDKLMKLIRTTLNVYVEKFGEGGGAYSRSISQKQVEEIFHTLGPKRIEKAGLAARVADAIVESSELDNHFKEKSLSELLPSIAGTKTESRVKKKLKRLQGESKKAHARQGKGVESLPGGTVGKGYESPQFLFEASQTRERRELVDFFGKEVQKHLPHGLLGDDHEWIESFFWAHWHVECFEKELKAQPKQELRGVREELLRSLEQLRGEEHVPRGRTRKVIERMLKERFEGHLSV